MTTSRRIGLKLYTFSRHAEGIFLCVFTFLLVADVLLGILARYVQFDIVFADEIGKYLFIWLCMIGISAAARDNQHIRLNLIASKLPVSSKVTWILSQVLFLVFTIFFVYWGARLTLMHIQMEKSVMGFRFPMYVFTAAIPVGFTFTSIRILLDIAHTARKPDSDNLWEIPLNN